MDPLDELLNKINHTSPAPLPAGFEEKVLNKWFNERQENKSYPFIWYAAAACIIACTCINMYYLSETEIASTRAEMKTDSTFEESVVAEYGLIESISYYSLVE